MRVIRPGMVVGPQQRYMQLNQMKWAGWAAMDAHRPQDAESLPSPPMENTAELPEEMHEVAPSRPLTPARRTLNVVDPGTASKNGDAPCQPRKGRTIVEVTPEPEENMSPPRMSSRSSTPKRTVKSAVPSPSSERPDGSVRGIKRGSGRTPVPQATPQPLRGQAPTTSQQPQLQSQQMQVQSPAGRLVRSTSSASCSSSVSELDQRATKRRNGDSPLSKSGLSSPPPSRDTTPADDLPPSTFPIQEADEPATPPASKPTFDTAQVMMTPPTPKQSDLPRSRSLIPRRGAIPLFKDDKPERRSSKGRRSDGCMSDSEVDSVVSSATSASNSPAANTRSKLPTSRSRGLLSSPRVWNTLSRLGGLSSHD